MYRLLAASAVVETANSAALSDYYGVNAAGIAEIVVIFETTAHWPKCLAHLHKRGLPAAASNISLVSGVLGIAEIDRVWPYELSFVDSY